jgi:pimeloyl-ACP methyl ester carboxylesterase
VITASIAVRRRARKLCSQVYHNARKHHSFGNIEVAFVREKGVNYLVFRGSDEFSDWWTNICFFSKKVRGIGKFHRGFLNNIRAHRDEILAIIPEKYKDQQIIICGHSKGGAEAQLFALFCRDIAGAVITFGAPKPIKRIYDAEIEEWLREITTHYIITFDNVTKLPPFWMAIGKEVRKRVHKLGSEHFIDVYGEVFDGL